MTRLKVIQPFVDKYTGQLYGQNTTIEVTEERAGELIPRTDLVQLVEEADKVEKPAAKAKKKAPAKRKA